MTEIRAKAPKIKSRRFITTIIKICYETSLYKFDVFFDYFLKNLHFPQKMHDAQAMTTVYLQLKTYRIYLQSMPEGKYCPHPE